MLRKHTNWFMIAMNLLYGITIGISFHPSFGPVCRVGKLYPPCMNFVNSLFILNYFYHLYMHSQGYWLKWQDYEEIKPAVKIGLTRSGLE